MFKKILLVILPVISIVITGCNYEKQIDTASLAETITVTKKNESYVYTFYLIDSEEDVNRVSVNANSLKQAVAVAENYFIPNLSLSKLELFLFSESSYTEAIESDISYISTQYNLSPLVFTAVCNEQTLDYMEKTKDAPKQIEEHILLLKNKESNISENCLSVFNHLASKETDDFIIPHIISNEELKAEAYKY